MNADIARQYANLVCALHGIKAALKAIHHDDMAILGVLQLVDWTIEHAESLSEDFSENMS